MRIIAHLDMDAFFASIEEADNEIFRGKPIVVGSDPQNGHGRGVVSTANYKAREYGIHSALPISVAWQLSQKAKAQGELEVVFLQPNFERYQEVSAGVLEIIQKNVLARGSHDFGVLLQQASIDEFYFSVSGGPAEGWDFAIDLCKKIKQEIKQKYKITCSVGIGPNKLIAKIAAGTKKPDGLFVVRYDESEIFLEPLSIREIPGVGPKTEAKLNKENIFTVKDAKRFSQEELKLMLGKFGQDLYNKVRAIDNSPLEENGEAKSIGQQSTFDKDTLDAVFIGNVIDKLCNDVFLRFKNSDFKNFKTIAITVRFSGFDTHTSAKTLNESINSEKIFKLEVLKLLLPYLDIRKNPNKKLIRLIGISIKNFNS